MSYMHFKFLGDPVIPIPSVLGSILLGGPVLQPELGAYTVCTSPRYSASDL